MATQLKAKRDYRISPEEWETRVDLALFYRAIARFGWTDLIYTHVSARVPGHDDHFLINPYGLLFEEVTASNLIVLDMQGNVVAGDYPANRAGFSIHSAVLKARPDVRFVAHTHTRAGVGVSCMKAGLMMLTQQAMLFHDRLAYHDWDHQTGNEAECDKLAMDLADKPAIVLRNHGLLTVGPTAPEAFFFLYGLETACRFQMDAMQAGAELVHPTHHSVVKTAEGFFGRNEPIGLKEWAAMRRAADREDPSYKD